MKTETVATHTPTPWTAAKVEFDKAAWEELFAGITTTIGKGQDIWAIVYGRTDEEEQANAAFIVRAVNSHEELLATMRDIASMENQTLLGKCCTEKTCRPSEDTSCELQLKANHAFAQAAALAKQAIAKVEAL